MERCEVCGGVRGVRRCVERCGGGGEVCEEVWCEVCGGGERYGRGVM